MVNTFFPKVILCRPVFVTATKGSCIWWEGKINLNSLLCANMVAIPCFISSKLQRFVYFILLLNIFLFCLHNIMFQLSLILCLLKSPQLIQTVWNIQNNISTLPCFIPLIHDYPLLIIRFYSGCRKKGNLSVWSSLNTKRGMHVFQSLAHPFFTSPSN